MERNSDSQMFNVYLSEGRQRRRISFAVRIYPEMTTLLSMHEGLDVETERGANTANVFSIQLLENSRLSCVIESPVAISGGIGFRGRF